MPTFQLDECANYFSACGYNPEWSKNALTQIREASDHALRGL